MKHCLNCYRLIENDTDECPYCGTTQDYSTPENIIKHKKCPRCFAYLYDDENGCRNCGYHKKNKSPLKLILIILLFILCLLGLIILLNH